MLVQTDEQLKAAQAELDANRCASPPSARSSPPPDMTRLSSVTAAHEAVAWWKRNRRLEHRNLLPMLASEVVAQSPANTTGELPQVVYMLFPAYEEGTLQDALTASGGGGGGGAGGAGTWVFTPRQVLGVWDQVAAAVEAMHSATPPMAHNDIKPHNVLLRARGRSAHVRRFEQLPFVQRKIGVRRSLASW